MNEPRRGMDFSRELAEKGWYHSFELPDGTSIEGYNKIGWLRTRYGRFPIPEDLDRQAGARYRRLGWLVQLRGRAPRRRGDLHRLRGSAQFPGDPAAPVLAGGLPHTRFLRVARSRPGHLRFRLLPGHSLSPEASAAGARNRLRPDHRHGHRGKLRDRPRQLAGAPERRSHHGVLRDRRTRQSAR